MSDLDGQDPVGRHAAPTDLVGVFDVSHLSVRPGSSVSVSIPVTNTGEVIDGVTAIVDGVEPDWVRLERPVVSVFPDETTPFDISFDAPSDCPAGDYLVVVRLVSTIEPGRESVHDFWLTVQPVASLTLDLTPQIITAGAEGRFTARVVNTGNAVADVRVDALESTRELDIEVDPAAFFVPAGESASVDVRMRGRRPWFGQPDARSILVTARVDDFTVEKTATFNQRPRVSRGVITMLVLALILLLWALIFLFAFDALRSNEAVVKVGGGGFPDGQSEIPIALVDASVDGAVRAETTGEGVARATVEAFRVTSDGTLEAAGSAATVEDGFYSLATLLPGTYVFRVVGEGFDNLWYPDVQVPAAEASGQDGSAVVAPVGAREVRLDPNANEALEDMLITGEPGTLKGKIALPLGTDVDAPVTVTVAPASGGVASGFADSSAAPQTQVLTIRGANPGLQPDQEDSVSRDLPIEFNGLSTPLTYDVTATGPGFDPLEFEQEVRGGSPTIFNSVNLTAATNDIVGTVIDQSGEVVGDVEVTLRSGDFVAIATTPTTGPERGAFRFVGLETPATYTLAFAADGFGPTTRAVDLQPDVTPEPFVVGITGGVGTLTGAAVSPTGAPLGGLTVEVIGDDFRQETTTLTSAGSGGGSGSFSLSSIPVPGVYSVSVSGDGLQTETLDAVFGESAPVGLGDIVMLPDTSEVSGRILSTGAGVGQATVTLTNGVREFVTVSASSPSGLYSFSNVASGTYTVSVEAAGFETHVVLLRIQAGIDAVRDIEIGPPTP